MKKNQKRINQIKHYLPVLFMLFSVIQLNAQDKITRYPIESAKVTYNIKSPEGTGTKVLFFDHYGRRESQHETIQKRGKTVKDKITILNNGKSYSIDLLKNTAQDMSQATGMAMKMMAGATGNDMSATGKKMLEGMGGEKVGSETFLGKTCEKWEVHTMGKTTMLLWKGIPLKTETRVFGIKSTEEATSIKTGLSFSNADFLPPAKVKMDNSMEDFNKGMQMTDKDKQQLKKLQNMSYSDFKKMMKKDNPDLSDEEIEQSYKMMKKLGNFLK